MAKYKRLGFPKAFFSWLLDHIFFLSGIGTIIMCFFTIRDGQTIAAKIYNWKYDRKGFKFWIILWVAYVTNWILIFLTLGSFWIVSVVHVRKYNVWLHEKMFGYSKIFHINKK